MSVCAQCAQPTRGHGEFCTYHLAVHPDDWAAGNRLMCDFLHRGIVPPTPDRGADPLFELLDTTLELAA